MKRILITAGQDDVEPLLELFPESSERLLHLPLDRYDYRDIPRTSCEVIERLEQFRFVIHGSVRNSRFFLQWVQRHRLADRIGRLVHLVRDRRTADLLEREGVAAVLPKEDARPIDLMEFLLRISLQGEVLYPSPMDSGEEMPGLLAETGSACTELVVCREIPLPPEDRSEFRLRLKVQPPDAILFHSRSSVTRIRTAFPELDLENRIRIAASAGAAWKLEKEGMPADRVADGSWRSVKQLLEKEFSGR